MSDTISEKTPKLTYVANFLSLSRIILSPVLAWMVLYRNPWWLSFVLGVLVASTDKIDGELARYSKPTRTGAFLDTVADKVLLLFVGWAVVKVGSFSWIPMAIITVREVFMTVYRIYWGKKGLAMPARKSGKYKAFIQAIAIASAMLPLLEGYPLVDDVLIWVAVAITLFSAAQYIMDGKSALSTTGELSK